ncbi:MAG: divergent polysaccharide deacetylase family protein [Pseudomonadota bacterium]
MVDKRKKGKKSISKKKHLQKDNFSRIVLFVLISLLLILMVAVILLYTKQKIEEKRYPPVKTSKVPIKTKKELPKTKKKLGRYRVAIIIDDLGNNNGKADELLKIDAPLTFSIFPHGQYSKSIAQKVHATGKDIILHLPMEPHGYPEKNPGDGALFLSMEDEELLEKLIEDIESVPFIKGVNNHMGSKFTEDTEKMRIVLNELKNRGLFFLDSRTSDSTVGYTLAKEIGLKVAGRNIFLDNNQDINLINAQINKLVKLSIKNGSAIGICHPYPATIKALEQMLPDMKAKGVEIVPLSKLVK